MKYFSIEELIDSDTAKERGIDNTPGIHEVVNLVILTERLLDPIREKYGKPIIVNSGYRCDRLNKAVGGKPTSRHLTGCAADLWCQDLETIYRIASKMDYDECLFEHSSGGGSWLHVSYVSPELNRHKLGHINA